MNIRTFVAILSQNPQYDFPKMRGGGQRPFGTFPKIHPFWWGHPSLSTSDALHIVYSVIWHHSSSSISDGVFFLQSDDKIADLDMALSILLLCHRGCLQMSNNFVNMSS